MFNTLLTKSLDQIERKPLRYVLKNLLPMPMHTVGMLSSRGGMGKTFLALKIASAYVSEQNKNVLAWFSEDEAEIIAFRFDKTVKDFGMDPKTQEKIHYVTTAPIQIAKKDRGIFKADYDALYKIRQDCVMNNVGLIIIDPLLAFYGGDENDNSMARVFMQVFMEWSKQDGVNILFIHHGNKGDGGTRGAGAFTDATRFTYELHYPENEKGETDFDKVDEGIRTVRLVKDNHFVFQHFKKHCLPNSTEAEMKILPRHTAPEKDQSSAGKHIIYTGEKSDIPVEITEYEMDQPNPTVWISFSNHITENFRPKRISWNEIPDALCANENYASGSFKDGYRKAENYQMDAETIMLDIDDGMTIEEAQVAFKDFQAIIMTTKSHRKPKGSDKKICDRYRVILKAEGAIALDHLQFRDMMEKVHDFFGGIDPATKDASRFYYPSPLDCEVIYIEGSENFEWQRFHKLATLENERKSRELLEMQRLKNLNGPVRNGTGKPQNTLPVDYMFNTKRGPESFASIRDSLSPGAKVTVECRNGIDHEGIAPARHHSAVVMKQPNGNVTYHCSGARCSHEETVWCADWT